MLITTNNLPMNNGGLPWGSIILAVILVSGVGYLGYRAFQPPKPISEPKTKENERG
jgi:hypothetical protein